MPSLDLAVIGNCSVAALIDRRARFVWSCFPRFDGDPVFCALVDGSPSADPAALPARGTFAIEVVDQVSVSQVYLENTAVLVSTIADKDGNALEIRDFCPRFEQFGRVFRPPQYVRRIAPVTGRPRVRIVLRPAFGCGARRGEVTRGSSHVRFIDAGLGLRLTTDAPISYVLEEAVLAVSQPFSFILGPDEPLRAEVDTTAREFLDRTVKYWRDWVRNLSIPFEWQEAVIRSAITLKLCNYEETGAIVAALTTSIPEAPNTARNWDYRFCWVRDAYFVIQALNRLGATRTMEDYLAYVSNVADQVDFGAGCDLPPLYTLSRAPVPEETVATALAGYRGQGPVRIGNAASHQIQNDGYGAVVMAATHVFFDKRLIRQGNAALFWQLERLAERAAAVFDKPDAGPWELRTKAAVHTFSAVMCWAACDRLARIARGLDRERDADHWAAIARRLHETIAARIWSESRQSFVATFGGDELDATLLLLADLNFVTPDDPRFVATVEAVGRELVRGDLLLRYSSEDDFGHMSTGFLICAFWYVDALAAIGRKEEARARFERILSRRNSFGLLSEDADLSTGELWGNFPQTYSMVGLINAAMRLSRSWEEAI